MFHNVNLRRLHLMIIAVIIVAGTMSACLSNYSEQHLSELGATADGQYSVWRVKMDSCIGGSCMTKETWDVDKMTDCDARRNWIRAGRAFSVLAIMCAALGIFPVTIWAHTKRPALVIAIALTSVCTLMGMVSCVVMYTSDLCGLTLSEQRGATTGGSMWSFPSTTLVCWGAAMLAATARLMDANQQPPPQPGQPVQGMPMNSEMQPTAGYQAYNQPPPSGYDVPPPQLGAPPYAGGYPVAQGGAPQYNYGYGQQPPQQGGNFATLDMNNAPQQHGACQAAPTPQQT